MRDASHSGRTEARTRGFFRGGGGGGRGGVMERGFRAKDGGANDGGEGGGAEGWGEGGFDDVERVGGVFGGEGGGKVGGGGVGGGVWFVWFCSGFAHTEFGFIG